METTVRGRRALTDDFFFRPWEQQGGGWEMTNDDILKESMNQG